MNDQFERPHGDAITNLLWEVAQTMGGQVIRATNTVTGEFPARTPAVFQNLHSGMRIDPAPNRAAINTRLGDAYGLWRAEGLRPEHTRQANAMADSVGDLPGVEVLEGANFAANDTNRCGNYVLGERLGEDWAAPGLETDEALWTDTTAFLCSRGYAPVDDPAPGDVIVYSSEEPGADGHTTWADHFAMLEEDGRATSRLGLGPLVKHDIPAVPSIYGDRVFFFRKERS
jgi:hypothetical protein